MSLPVQGSQARLPEFDVALLERLPNAVSRGVFIDKWLTRRIGEASSATARLEQVIARLAAAQERGEKLIEAMRGVMGSAEPVVARIERAREEAVAEIRSAGERVRAEVVEPTRQALSGEAERAMAAARGVIDRAIDEQVVRTEEEVCRLLTEVRGALSGVRAQAEEAIGAVSAEVEASRRQWREEAHAIDAFLQASLSQALDESVERSESAGKVMEASLRSRVEASRESAAAVAKTLKTLGDDVLAEARAKMRALTEAAMEELESRLSDRMEDQSLAREVDDELDRLQAAALGLREVIPAAEVHGLPEEARLPDTPRSALAELL